MTTGAVLGWLALLLQLRLTIDGSVANGTTVFGAVVFYLSFFTVLTNILIAAQFSFPLWLPRSLLGKWFSRPSVQTASAVNIVIVGITYNLLLRHVWNPQGLQKLADVLLHDAMPLLYAAYWLLLAPKQGLRWTDALRWLPYPLLYLAYSLVSGAFTGTYPYPFIDVGVLGYGRTLMNAAMLTGAFVAMAITMIAIGRWLAGRSAASRME